MSRRRRGTKPTQEENEYQNILKIELTMKAPPWNPSSPEYSLQEQSIFNYRGRFVSPNTPARGQLFITSVTSYAYDSADVMVKSGAPKRLRMTALN